MGLTKIAITRPVFILMMMCLAMFGGIFSINNMRLEENPEVQFGVITVSTVYPGAGPEEVNLLVSRPIEDSISGINGLLEVTATSQEGVSVVVAQFEIGTNMDAALNDVRARVDQILGDLPREVLRPSISKLDGASEPVMIVSLSSDRLNAQELRTLSEDKIRDRFARIRGVAQVTISGGDEREVQVRLKRDRLLATGLGIADVQRALAAASLNVPSGRVVAPGAEFSVRVLGEFRNADEIGDMVIRISDPMNPNLGNSVRLRDIADVVDTRKEQRTISRVDSNPAVVVTIQKSREGNAVEISNAAKSTVIPALKSDFGVVAKITEDRAPIVFESVKELIITLVIGIILVTGIVYAFLHNFRGTIIVAIAIPICLLATFIVMALLGFTINSMSLLALALAIGVLVDDCIVVLENIYRHLQMGEDPREAAINGRGEIGLAAIAITLADVVVFLPMAFMGGVVGQFFRPLGVGFAVAVMLSLFVSFTVTPMLAARWYRKGEALEESDKGFAGWFNRGFHKLEIVYGRMLEWSLNHRWFVFITGFVLLFGVFMMIAGGAASSPMAAVQSTIPIMTITVILGVVGVLCNAIFYRKLRLRPLWGSFLFAFAFPLFAVMGFGYAQWKGGGLFNFEFAPASDQGLITMRVEMGPSSTIEQTTQVVDRLEKIAQDHPDVKVVTTQIGEWTGDFGGGGGSRGANLAQVRVKLYDRQAILDRIMFWVSHSEPLRQKRDTVVAADLTEKVGRIAGANITISTVSGFGFGAPIQMSFASDDRDLLLQTVQTIRQRLASGEIDGVVSPEISSKAGKPEFRAIPDRARMAEAGVTTADVATSMRLLYEGNDDVKLRVQGREFPIRVMMDLEDRNNPDLINSVPVTFSQGQPIFLPQVANVVDGTTVDKVERRNRQEEIRITANLVPGKAAGTVQEEINQWIQREKLLPEGVVIKPLGQADVQARESIYLMTTLLIGLVLVYVVLASLYDNLLYPFIIQLAQPQAFVGALLALILTDNPLNIVGFIGLIALVGLVGKNAILVVDYANTLRARGENRHDALVHAGRTRLRPILMTTLAILLGMLPVALAIGRGSEFRETLGITIIGGISLSTLLTLLVIPCSYTIFDDLSDLFTKRTGKRPSPRELFGRKGSAPAEETTSPTTP